MNNQYQINSKFFNELNFLLNYTEKIYSKYIDSNKIFLYAKILYTTNRRILELLIDNIYIFDEETHKDVFELMLHLEVWCIVWLKEFECQNPKIDDTFTFENKVNFPKVSVNRLLHSFVTQS